METLKQNSNLKAKSQVVTSVHQKMIPSKLAHFALIRQLFSDCVLNLLTLKIIRCRLIMNVLSI